MWTLVGDGDCNDETNNVECSFDGGDCCKSDTNLDSCTSCDCFLEVSFLPCQWNLIKNLQNEANTPLITKITLNTDTCKKSLFGDIILETNYL
jgi:hypothetical protein